MKTLHKKARETTALLKDLNLQIDFLIGYAPSGYHYKQEWYIRETLLNATLESEETPEEIRTKIYKIQESIHEIQTKQYHEQPYLSYKVKDVYPSELDLQLNILHPLQINDRQHNQFYTI